MKRSLRSLVTAAALAPIAVVSASGCADNESSLFLMGVAQVEPPDCTVRPDANSTILFDGTLDVGIGNRYVAPLIVGNQMTPRGDKENLRTETARVTLKGAEVRLEESDGAVIEEFTVPGTGFATINQAEQAGFGAIGVVLIPASIANTLRSEIPPHSGVRTIIANIIVFGDTLGGRELESSELAFPIEVCNGCSIRFPIEALDPNTNECIRGAVEDAQQQTACLPGQNSTTLCSECVNEFEICRCPPNGECQDS